MTARFIIDVDAHMFKVANERPFVWKYIFLNQFMQRGINLKEYFPLFHKNPPDNMRALQYRHLARENIAENVATFCRSFDWDVVTCRTVVINLCLNLQHLAKLLGDTNHPSDEIIKPEVMGAVRDRFFEIAALVTKLSVEQLATQCEVDETDDPIEETLLLFRNEKVWPKNVDNVQLMALLFRESKGDNLEQKNPCEHLQNTFKAALKVLDSHLLIGQPNKKLVPEDFLVPSLVNSWGSMCTAHQCCRTVFTESSLKTQKVRKGFFATRGILELAPDKPVAALEEQDGPYPSVMLNAIRQDLLVILKCSGYKDTKDGVWDVAPEEWRDAFFALTTDDTVEIPLYNFRVIQSLGEELYYAMNPGESRVGGASGHYRLPVVGGTQQEETVKPKEKPTKSVTFAPTDKAVIMEKDNSLSIALLVIAAGLVTLQLRR